MSQPSPSDRPREVTTQWPTEPPAGLAPGPAPAAGPRSAAPDFPGAPLASGFPTYVGPPPSPKDRTSLLVGTLVVVVVALFAVLGFWLVR